MKNSIALRIDKVFRMLKANLTTKRPHERRFVFGFFSHNFRGNKTKRKSKVINPSIPIQSIISLSLTRSV